MAVDLDNFPYSDAAKRMLSYVTAHWYDKSYVGKWTYEVMGQQMDLAVKYCQELPLQFDVDTATWGLMYWEQMYGLPIRSSLSYEERRRLIHLKMEPRYSSTPYWMAQTIENTTGYTANVYDINDPGPYSYSHPNIFHVLLSGDAEEQFAVRCGRKKQSANESRCGDRGGAQKEKKADCRVPSAECVQ